MSIVVENIVKKYGSQNALDDVSFIIKPGEIVGLLGPNGAGKSTMMKIITCFIPPTSGNVTVYGHNIFDESLEVRKKVGYLPENNPLYHDLYIKEYLEFVAGIYKIKNKKARIEEMIDITGLEAERNKKIGALSKGFRQRVGLAQALIHNPDVLILDEPTSGLDPNQLIDIRNLIKEIGKEKTVMLSTHIMQEVEALCKRVIIIDKGKIVADDATAQLTSTAGNSVVLKVEFNKPVQSELLKSIKGVLNVVEVGKTSFELISENLDVREQIFNFAVKNDLAVLSMQQSGTGIEKVFHELTQSKNKDSDLHANIKTSLLNTITQSNKKSKRLIEISKKLSEPLDTNDFSKLLSQVNTTDKDIEELIDIAESDESVKIVMKNYKATRQTLKMVYIKLSSIGGGDEGGHFVPASSLVYPLTLKFILNHFDGKEFSISNYDDKNSTLIILNRLSEYFKNNEVGEIYL